MKKQAVETFLSTLAHPQAELITQIRQTIKEAAPGLLEGIKWNAPSYALNGNDIITFNFRNYAYIALIFHTGPKGKDTQTGQRLFADTSGQLTWLADKRCVFKFADPEQSAEQVKTLHEIVQKWVQFAYAQFEPEPAKPINK